MPNSGTSASRRTLIGISDSSEKRATNTSSQLMSGNTARSRLTAAMRSEKLPTGGEPPAA
jgi:hypothetical protein